MDREQLHKMMKILITGMLLLGLPFVVLACAPEEEAEGICESCKTSRSRDDHAEEEDKYDPAIT